jgi:hypothetical protein
MGLNPILTSFFEMKGIRDIKGKGKKPLINRNPSLPTKKGKPETN